MSTIRLADNNVKGVSTSMSSEFVHELSENKVQFVIITYENCKFHSIYSGGSRIFQMGGHCFVANGGAHILFSGKKCMKLKEIGLKWGGARLLAPCYSKITIFL